jgi:hypothetical protein
MGSGGIAPPFSTSALDQVPHNEDIFRYFPVPNYKETDQLSLPPGLNLNQNLPNMGLYY